MNYKVCFAMLALYLGIFISCSTTKNKGAYTLYGHTWELDYISGPRIAFEGLFPDQKPQITFDRTTQRAVGTDSCNGYSAPFKSKRNHLSFSDPYPTTMRYCGEGEKQFISMMQKVNAYSFSPDGKLNLKLDDVTILRFKKNL